MRLINYLLFSIVILFLNQGCKDAYKENRCFAVFFQIQKSTDSRILTGNFNIGCDTMPNIDSLEKIVYDTWHCEKDFTIQECSITGIYEYKNKADVKIFSSKRNKKMSDCTEVILDIDSVINYDPRLDSYYKKIRQRKYPTERIITKRPPVDKKDIPDSLYQETIPLKSNHDY